MSADPGGAAPRTREPASCWLRGCLFLAMIVPTILVIILVMMTMSRLANQA